MKYETWVPLFNQIKKDLSLSWESDEKAAGILNELLHSKSHLVSFSLIHKLLSRKDVMIFGAGPSLDTDIDTYISLTTKCNVIAADGATSALLKKEIVPTIIVTDFDGNVSDQLEANRQGSILLVHAHGDNIPVLENTIPKVQGSILGSIQTDPKKYSFVFNVGGFTDGDRAAYLADHCNAKTIYMLGFDFLGKLGQYSLPETKNADMKRKKLTWCSYLITKLPHAKRIRFLP
jgi:uncharacterized Rossmann fold enzyme